MANDNIMLTWCLLDGRTGHQAGRDLLAQLYRDATGEALPPIAIAPKGKPYFPDSPWHFSISHTKRHAFCVLAKCPIGIDAEEMDRPFNLRLAVKVLSDSEKLRFEGYEDKRDAFLRLWVLKEAAVKLTGNESKLLKQDMVTYGRSFASKSDEQYIMTLNKRSENAPEQSNLVDLLVSWHIQEYVLPLEAEEVILFDPMDETQVDLTGLPHTEEKE